MTHKPTPTPAVKAGRSSRVGARVPDSTRHDPYAPKAKYRSMRCGTCGAVYKAGRWQWSPADAGPLGTCPACKRVAERMPAGRITLEGPYAKAHEAELVRLARHEAEAERAEHPMHRIIDVQLQPAAIDITTTDIHLPRRIGEALRRAHDGDLTIAYSEDAYEVRVDWRR
jgi:hypothetical protein